MITYEEIPSGGDETSVHLVLLLRPSVHATRGMCLTGLANKQAGKEFLSRHNLARPKATTAAMSYCHSVRVMPRIPLIEDLTKGPIPHSSFLLVEFTGASQWYNASFTISAGWLKTVGRLGYNSLAHPPDDVRSKLYKLGLDCEQLETEDKLYVTDLYTATLDKAQ